MDFGKVIHNERIKQGLSRKELAEKAGFTKRAIIYWESGERTMSIENADRLFKALNITIKIGV